MEHVKESKTGLSKLSTFISKSLIEPVHMFGLVEWNVNTSWQSFMCTSAGSSGSAIQLSSNCFRILSRPRWVLYQYHVDFNPPMESRRLRSALLFQHEETLGSSRTFDGAILFLPRRLHNKVSEDGSDVNRGAVSHLAHLEQLFGNQERLPPHMLADITKKAGLSSLSCKSWSN